LLTFSFAYKRLFIVLKENAAIRRNMTQEFDQFEPSSLRMPGVIEEVL
jgi:hypothetical protein